jgi:uncharacterized membrane protein YbhN (UPF0104 family)
MTESPPDSLTLPSRVPWLRLLAGVAIGAAALAVALWGVRLDEVAARLSSVQGGWLLLATASVLAVAFTKAARWQALLTAGQPAARHVPLRPVFEVLLIGQMLNIVVPLRVGEIARIVLLGRPGGPSKSAVFCTIVVEKLIDLLFTGLLAVLVVPLVIGQLDVVDSAVWSLALGGAVALGLLVLRRWRHAWLAWFAAHILPRLPARARGPLARLADAIMLAFDVLAAPRTLLVVAGWSLVVWCFSALSFVLLFRALALDLPPLAALGLLVVAQLGFVPPSAPGLIGIMNAVALAVLPAFNVDATSVAAYGILAHLVLVVPPVVLGAWFLATAGWGASLRRGWSNARD